MKELPAAEEPSPVSGDEDPPMTIWEHLTELRKRVVVSLCVFLVCSVIAWEFREAILSFLVDPFAKAWRDNGVPGEVTLHFQTPAAALIAYFKLALLGGAALASPVMFYQLWSFVAPGLYAREKKFVIPFVLCSTTLFVGGGLFGWSLAFPLAFKYLLSLSGTLEIANIQVTPTVMMGDYISFVTRMLFGFGMIFEIPLFIFFLSIAGIVNYLHLIRYGRWFVVGSFLASAAITPPDPTSQVLMAFPMILLYGSSIILARLFGKKPSEAQREAYRARRERAREQRRLRREAKQKAKEAKKKAKAEDST